MELPEPNGEKKIFQEKVFIPVQQHPEVSVHSHDDDFLLIINNISYRIILVIFRNFISAQI